MYFKVLTQNGDIVYTFSHEHYYYIYNQDSETTTIYWQLTHTKIKDFNNSCIIDE